MKTIAIYSGRFHPFHRGHLAVYRMLVNKFGQGNVYIATSNKKAPQTSPFSFKEKKKLMVAMGVPEKNITLVSRPYAAREITDNFDSNNTAVVYALGEKDMGRIPFTNKDGNPSYMQPYTGKMQSVNQHSYVLTVPTVNFSVMGKRIDSASQIRDMYKRANNKQRVLLLRDMYGKYARTVKPLFDKFAAINERVNRLLSAMQHHTLLESKQVSRIKHVLERFEMVAHRGYF